MHIESEIKIQGIITKCASIFYVFNMTSNIQKMWFGYKLYYFKLLNWNVNKYE